ncbi:MAG: hypothetical protein WBX02_08975 [Terriglobales bacterium]
MSPKPQTALEPLLAAIESLSDRIHECNEGIETLAQESYPQVARLKQVKGVGTLIELTYLLTLRSSAVCETACGVGNDRRNGGRCRI